MKAKQVVVCHSKLYLTMGEGGVFESFTVSRVTQVPIKVLEADMCECMIY